MNYEVCVVSTQIILKVEMDGENWVGIHHVTPFFNLVRVKTSCIVYGKIERLYFLFLVAS